MKRTKIPNKHMVIEAGYDLMSHASRDKKIDHQQVIDWINTLQNIQDATPTPKENYISCYWEWYEKHVEGRGARLARLAKEAIGF